MMSRVTFVVLLLFLLCTLQSTKHVLRTSSKMVAGGREGAGGQLLEEETMRSVYIRYRILTTPLPIPVVVV